MKRLIGLNILMALVISLWLCSGACAETHTSGVFEYTVKGNGTATIVGYTGGQEDIILPSMIDGYQITSIGVSAFALEVFDTRSISVTIPDSITSIGEKAFWQRNVKTINIPDSVSSIGAGAFVGCLDCQFRISGNHPYFAAIDNNLYEKSKKMLIAATNCELLIPNGIEEIGSYACYQLSYYRWKSKDESVSHLPNHVYSLYNWDLIDFVSEQDPLLVSIPDSLLTIDDYAFSGNLLSTNIYYSFSREEYEALNDDERDIWEYILGTEGVSLSQATFKTSTPYLGLSLKSIGNYAFSNCIFRGFGKTYDSANFMSNSIESIGNYAFSDSLFVIGGKDSIDINIILPDKINDLGVGAFMNVTGYRHRDSENISYNPICFSFLNNPFLTTIKDYTFYNDHNAWINICEFGNINDIGSYALYGTIIHESLPTNLESIGEYCFAETTLRFDDQRLVIPSTCEEIPTGAFLNATGEIDSLVILIRYNIFRTIEKEARSV